MASSNSFRPNDILRSQSSRVCTILSGSDDLLLLFAGKLYDKGIIDRLTKNEVRRTKGYEGADIMMDYLLTKLGEQPSLFETVLDLMKEIELLSTVAAELEASADSGTQGQGIVSTDGPSYSRGPKIAPSKALKKHMTGLLDVISAPDKLATDLYNNDLIAKSIEDEVLTTSGLSRYAKASKIVNDFQRQLNVFDERDTFVKFCDVLKKQGNPALERKAKEMLYEV